MGSLDRRGEARRTVVVAFPGAEAQEALATLLGSEFDVRDIREAPERVDIVLCPPVSPQAIGQLRREYPSAWRWRSTETIEVEEAAALTPADPSAAIPDAHGDTERREVVQPVPRRERADP